MPLAKRRTPYWRGTRLLARNCLFCCLCSVYIWYIFHIFHSFSNICQVYLHVLGFVLSWYDCRWLLYMCYGCMWLDKYIMFNYIFVHHVFNWICELLVYLCMIAYMFGLIFMLVVCILTLTSLFVREVNFSCFVGIIKSDFNH